MRRYPSQQIFKKWAGAVVTVETATKTGTGFFDNNRLLYTAYHVLDGASAATITFPDGRKANITGALVADKSKDYAILMTDSAMVGPALGDYTALEPGERLTVIGSPLGLAQTVTEGIVSAKRQEGNRQLLQLSAGISPGSSGSPVFDTQGGVVGLVVETREDGQTLNFAVSSADLKGFAGVPLSLAFAAPSAPGARGSVLCACGDPRLKDLIDHDANGYVGLKGVRLIVEDLPDALSGVVGEDDLRQWVSGTLTNGGVKVMTGDDLKGASGAIPTSGSDIDFLRWADSSSGAVYVQVTAVRMGDGSVSLSYNLNVWREGIIMPGWTSLVTVDTAGAVQCLGAARDMKEDVRQEVAGLAAQIVSRYQYANRPSDASAASDGR